MSDLITVGDIHLQNSVPKRYQGLDFLKWLFSQEFNNKNNYLLLLGDLCEVNSPYELFEVFMDYFLNKSKFKKIYIVQGNHDCVNLSTILALFRPLPNVEIITDVTSFKLENTNMIFLPYYNHEGTSKIPMVERYSNLESEFTENYSYGFGHIEDDTEHFSKKFCDTSKLKVSTWMNGHIHTSNIQNGGHYLGAPILNSSTESGKIPYIARINLESKDYELIEVPKFLEYYEVEYPNKLPKIDTKYGLFLVKNSIDKNTTIEEYSKQAKEMGFEFYARRIMNKKATVEIEERKNNSSNLTFDEFAKVSKLDDSVADICREIIKLKGE